MNKSTNNTTWQGGAVARFFLWCSGARLYLLKRCPTEINMFMGIGIVVFLTGIVASISGGYAFHLVFNSIPLAIVFGVFWGILIFFLDWYLVASLKKERKWGKEFVMALPRIILAVFIAVVVARPIEMKLFEKEIDLQVQKAQLEKRQEQMQNVLNQFGEIEQLRQENDSLQQLINKKAERRNELYDLMIAEAEGRSPVGVMGKGPVYKEKQREYAFAVEELKELRTRIVPQIASNNERIAVLNQKKDELAATNQIVISRANGFLSRLRALNELQEEEKTVYWASLFILLLFVVIEISPVFVKLISSRGPYDELFEAEQAALSQKAGKQVLEFAHERHLFREELERKSELMVNQNDRVQRDAYEALTDAKQEINRERIKRWKDIQLKKNGDTVNKYFPDLVDIDKKRTKEGDEENSTHSS
ncbi:hypothetical protein L21SP5_02687 [Salinivirga cyanobacteriivorans]|uniref:DUF4407 domain-containing protein n=1 Tax=Salinivirga cyanobacteriivorans TaxID=1307839 RepID=A0A0S2I1V0_9BACT|nr:DUF4407 domain-containing protein [Salinivirga cyanobacteriivorans]ALO16310.1 hypothetical protein L21SP5_02687 [Salinivirga cyanobacteriivorans]